MVDLIVLSVIACLGLGSFACAMMGLAAMMSDKPVENYVTNLLCGLTLTLFSTAILTACLYTRLPFGNGEGYVIPLGFAVLGVIYLAVSGKQHYDAHCVET